MNLFGKPKKRRITITARMFASMVFGYPIDTEGIEMLFEDMGFDVMHEIIQKAKERPQAA